MLVAEGPKLIEVALHNGRAIESAFVAPEARRHPEIARVLGELERGGARVFELAPGVMERVADTVTPQPVCAVVAAEETTLPDLLAAAPPGDRLYLVCADVRDPGNLGSVLRIAAASGSAGVITCAGSVDPSNPKVVRASAGAVFQLPVVRAPAATETLQSLRSAGVRVLGTTARGGTDYLAAELSGVVALVLGNEASGLTPGLEASLDEAVTIPMASGSESLNVAMTAAVLCFEARRRARSAPAAPPGMPSGEGA